MSLEDKVKWSERKNKKINPLDFFRENYTSDITRGELVKQDPSLYRILHRKKLLSKAIPQFDEKSSKIGRKGGKAGFRDFGENPLKYYEEHYGGMTKGILARECLSLYLRLKKEGLLEKVPTLVAELNKDPVAYYKEHYEGITRGRLSKECPKLYQSLWRKGLLKYVPLKK